MKPNLHILNSKEGDYYIAHCLEFDLISQGYTHQEARDNLTDLISSYLQFAKEKDIEQFAYYPAPKIYWDREKKEPKA